MASKYLITKNVLKEYDDHLITLYQEETQPTFRDRLHSKLKEVIIKDSEKKNKSQKVKHLDFIYLYDIEYAQLVEWYGVSKVEELIARMNDYIGSKGDKYKSHYHTALTWFNQKGIKKIENKPKIIITDNNMITNTVPGMSDEKKKEILEKMRNIKDSFRGL